MASRCYLAIFTAAVGEEGLDLFGDDMRRLVNQGSHPETADEGVS
jgi:hypothetical protein